VYKNKTTTEVLSREKESPGDFTAIADLVRGENYRKSFHETGDTEDSVWSAGQVMGLIDEVVSCQDLIDGMVQEAEDIIQVRLNGLIE